MIVITDSIERLIPLLEVLEDAQREQVVKSWQTDNNTQHPQEQQAHTWLITHSEHTCYKHTFLDNWSAPNCGY